MNRNILIAVALSVTTIVGSSVSHGRGFGGGGFHGGGFGGGGFGGGGLGGAAGLGGGGFGGAGGVEIIAANDAGFAGRGLGGGGFGGGGEFGGRDGIGGGFGAGGIGAGGGGGAARLGEGFGGLQGGLGDRGALGGGAGGFGANNFGFGRGFSGAAPSASRLNLFLGLPSDSGISAAGGHDYGMQYSGSQLAVDKAGVVRGNYFNTTDKNAQHVQGAVDKKTQRITWIVVDRPSIIFDTGLYNLTQNETTIIVHFDKDRVEQWTLVRLKQDRQTTTAP